MLVIRCNENVLSSPQPSRNVDIVHVRALHRFQARKREDANQRKQGGGVGRPDSELL
jgi:hypothetical protein